MDLGPYLLRLAVVLPLLCVAIVALLWLARRHLGAGLAAAAAPPGAEARVAAWTLLAPGLRLATIDFADRRLLVGVSRAGLVVLAETGRPAAPEATASSAPAAPAATSAPGVFARLLAQRLGHG